MEQKHYDLFLKVFGIVAMFFGISALLLPVFTASLQWKNEFPDDSLILVRGWGATLLALGLISFNSAKLDKATKDLVSFGIFLYSAPITIFRILDVMSQDYVIMGYMTIGLELLFAVGSGYFRFMFKSE